MRLRTILTAVAAFLVGYAGGVLSVAYSMALGARRDPVSFVADMAEIAREASGGEWEIEATTAVEVDEEDLFD